MEDGVTCSPPVSSAGSDSGIAMMSPLEADFSTAVFGQLTSDLQQMLGIGSSNGNYGRRGSDREEGVRV